MARIPEDEIERLKRQVSVQRVEILAPNVYEVEFSDNEGRTFASLALKANQLMVLHYQPVRLPESAILKLLMQESTGE